MRDVVARLHPACTGTASIPVGQMPPWVRSVLHEAAVTQEHLLGIAFWWASTVPMASGAWVLFGRGTALVLAAVMGLVPFVLLARRSGRRSQLIVEGLPDTVDTIGRSLRSGASLHQALTEAAAGSGREIGDELRLVLGEISRGESAPTALRRWATRMPREEVRITAAALAVATEHESGTMYALGGVAQTLRDRAALAGEVRALVSQAVASTRALLLLPVAFIAIDSLGDRSVLNYLVNEPIGRVCLGAGLTLNSIGAVWIHLTVRRRLPA